MAHSAGFAETGDAGRAIQDAMLAKVRAAGMRMVGPNCLGLLNADPAVVARRHVRAHLPAVRQRRFSSQSGALGLAILDHAKALGIGISQFVSIGNKADVSGNDLIEYWEDDAGAPRSSCCTWRASATRRASCAWRGGSRARSPSSP
jgi:acyl-CoA synthetase (NDP forming)